MHTTLQRLSDAFARRMGCTPRQAVGVTMVLMGFMIMGGDTAPGSAWTAELCRLVGLPLVMLPAAMVCKGVAITIQGDACVAPTEEE